MPLITPSDLELKTIRSLVNFTGQRVLELGAGDGRLAWPFAPEAARWIALDPDADELNVAAQALGDNPAPTVRLLLSDARAVCFPADYFDLALFTWSLC